MNQYSSRSMYAAAKGLCAMASASGRGAFLSRLHSVKQAGKRLAALAELLVISEILHFAVVRCGVNRGLAGVVNLL
jgi:hypothetical protein